MRHRAPEVSNDVTVYLVLNDHGQFGIAYDETDPAQADRETIIRNFLSGQYSNALRVVAFNAAEERLASGAAIDILCRDIDEVLLAEAQSLDARASPRLAQASTPLNMAWGNESWGVTKDSIGRVSDCDHLGRFHPPERFQEIPFGSS
jgi:hypothetical protein